MATLRSGSLRLHNGQFSAQSLKIVVYKSLLLFGAPGSGKGTQGKIIGTIPGFYHCACGDVFRAVDVRSDHTARPSSSTPAEANSSRMTSASAFGPRRSTAWSVPVTLQTRYRLPRARWHSPQHQPGQDSQAPRSMSAGSSTSPAPTRPRSTTASSAARLKENRLDDINEQVIERRSKDVYEDETKPVLEYLRAEIDHPRQCRPMALPSAARRILVDIEHYRSAPID